MDCNKCSDELTALLDGELGAREAEQVRSHLNVCKSCSDELRSLQESKEFIEARVVELTPRPEAWNLVRARIYTDPPLTPVRFYTLTRWRVAMAAMALIAAFGLGYLQYQQTQRKVLEQYISRYIQERDARGQAKPVLTSTQSDADLNEMSPAPDNPFLEIKAVVSDNPFRSEDQ